MTISYDQFLELLDAVPAGILVNQDGVMKYANPAFQLMVGYTQEELFSRPFTDVILPEDHELVLGRYRQRIEGELPPDDYSFRLLTKDGDIRWIKLRVRRMKWEGRFAVVSFVVDITEELASQRALEVSEERFRLAFETSPDAMTINRLEDGRYIDLNEGFTNTTGYTKEECLGQSYLDIDIWEDTRDRVEMLEPIRDRKKVTNREAPFRRKNGSIFTGLVSATLMDLHGEPHILTITRDISELKKSEAERVRLQKQLLQSQKMEAVGILAGGIAHDFNNILAAITGYAEISLANQQKGDYRPQEIRKLLGAAGRAKKLVQQILTFSRKSETILTRLDLREVVREAVGLAKRTFPKMVSFNLDLAPDLRPVQGNSVQLEQVVLNLLSNSCDAMPGGGELRLRAENTNVLSMPCDLCGAEFSGDFVLLTISDSGHGMDAQTKDKIFDPFFTTKDVGQGTGLGLSTVFGVTKSHGGHIVVQSSPGRGTVFKIYLPVSGQDRQVAVTKAPEATGKTHGIETILLVDDEPMLREIGSEILTRHGYRTILAENGERALEIFVQAGRDIDLVVLDLSMPGMGGQKCREHLLDINSDIKILIASGYPLHATDEDLAICRSPDYLAKPYRASELLAAVRYILDRDSSG